MTVTKVNYLNNRDLLKEIHLSKATYCSFQDRALDHQFDIILPSVAKINRNTIAEAKRIKADRLKKEQSIEVNPKKIHFTDLVFRVTCWDHIPLAPLKEPKSKIKKAKISDIFDFDGDVTDVADIQDLSLIHI